MDRQAAMLFGAIVAVGLGPAVWLGGTLFGSGPVPMVPVSTPEVTASPGASPTEPESPSPASTVPVTGEEFHPERVWIPRGSPRPGTRPAPTSTTASPARTPTAPATRTSGPQPTESPSVTPSAVG